MDEITKDNYSIYYIYVSLYIFWLSLFFVMHPLILSNNVGTYNISCQCHSEVARLSASDRIIVVDWFVGWAGLAVRQVRVPYHKAPNARPPRGNRSRKHQVRLQWFGSALFLTGSETLDQGRTFWILDLREMTMNVENGVRILTISAPYDKTI